jgi:protein-tyrosine-phosphatase
MAEGWARHLKGDVIDAYSSGVDPHGMNPNAVRVMAERGVGIAGRPTKHLSRFARSRFDRVITLCDRVREICPEFPGRPMTAHWSMPDPVQEGDTDEATYPAFLHTAEELETRIGPLIAQMTTEGGTTDGN